LRTKSVTLHNMLIRFIILLKSMAVFTIPFISPSGNRGYWEIKLK
jgi:hypothetical protein